MKIRNPQSAIRNQEMRQRFYIFALMALVALVLIALNTLNYKQLEREPDTEWEPDRSTYNAGATGVRAFYDYLSESGHQVLRWRVAATMLTKEGVAKPSTFVVIGATKEEFSDDERKAVLEWVREGGRLVLIDRAPSRFLLPNAGNVQINTQYQSFPSRDARPSNADEMTAGVSLAKIAQPTRLTHNVESVLPSRFASHINFLPAPTPAPPPPPVKAENSPPSIFGDAKDEAAPSPPMPKPPPPVFGSAEEPSPAHKTRPPKAAPQSNAPVMHLVDYQGALLVDYVYGQGRILLLSDPFIVANGGLKRADNLQLAVNLVAGVGRLVAFDEYHQGHGSQQNQFFAYFAGTPVVPLLAQGGLLIALLVWARGRRFARALPLPQVDRRSKLEFVASMAELQARARAYDLALENIYTRTRRALVRYAGVGHDTPRQIVAANVAARSNVDAPELEKLMQTCEDHIHGEPLKANEALILATRLRRLEAHLGLQNRTHESKR